MTVLWVELTEASAKIRADGAHDEPGDETWPAWAGVVPVRLVAGAPEPEQHVPAGDARAGPRAPAGFAPGAVGPRPSLDHQASRGAEEAVASGGHDWADTEGASGRRLFRGRATDGRRLTGMRRSNGSRGRARLGVAAVSALALVALMTAPGAAAPSTPSASPGDGPIDLTALYHDSRDGLYRTPGGAVPAGTTVTLRLRTRHDGATSVLLLLRSGGPYQSMPMQDVAPDVDCGAPLPAAGDSVRCDLWATK